MCKWACVDCGCGNRNGVRCGHGAGGARAVECRGAERADREVAGGDSQRRGRNPRGETPESPPWVAQPPSSHRTGWVCDHLPSTRARCRGGPSGRGGEGGGDGVRGGGGEGGGAAATKGDIWGSAERWKGADVAALTARRRARGGGGEGGGTRGGADCAAACTRRRRSQVKVDF